MQRHGYHWSVMQITDIVTFLLELQKTEKKAVVVPVIHTRE